MGTVTFENVDEFEADIIVSALQQEIVETHMTKMRDYVNFTGSHEERQALLNREDKYIARVQAVKDKFKYVK